LGILHHEGAASSTGLVHGWRGRLGHVRGHELL
jgi:hypothetical protein